MEVTMLNLLATAATVVLCQEKGIQGEERARRRSMKWRGSCLARKEPKCPFRSLPTWTEGNQGSCCWQKMLNQIDFWGRSALVPGLVGQPHAVRQ